MVTFSIYSANDTRKANTYMRRRRLVVALLAVAAALAGCEDTTVTPEAASTTTEATTNNVQREAQRAAAAAPSTTRATTPPVTEGPLGTTFAVNPGDRKITAYTFRSPVEPTSRFAAQPKAGMVFAAAEVQECAGPAGERFSPNRFDFELALTDNTRIQAGVEVQAPQLASSPLLPGDCIRGWVSFEVPAAGTVRHIVYSTGNASAKWRVA